ncbi:MAG: ECF transporter S component [Clostridia bacterium]|nr:ECF transporter S component [Clostridia bacterium]
MHNRKTKEMVLTALLIAIGIIIPVYFGFLRVILPPAFTATLMSHVPIFIAMFISPWSALFTAVGTTLGFAFAGLSPVVTARAASHIVFALIGAYMIKKRCSLANVGVVTTIIHALCEALTVYLFIKFGLMAAPEGSSIINASFYVVGIGTFIHSAIDYVIACLVGIALAKSHIIPPLTSVWMNK